MNQTTLQYTMYTRRNHTSTIRKTNLALVIATHILNRTALSDTFAVYYFKGEGFGSFFNRIELRVRTQKRFIIILLFKSNYT